MVQRSAYFKNLAILGSSAEAKFLINTAIENPINCIEIAELCDFFARCAVGIGFQLTTSLNDN